MEDANTTVTLKPDWAKGYSRKGAALHGLGEYEEAASTYEKGLEIEPENALLKKGLEDVQSSLGAGNPMANLFGGDMFAKIAGNPKLRQYLSNPDVMRKLTECQQNPNKMTEYMNDPAMMQIILGLMGLDGQMATNDDELEKAKQEANEDLEKRAAAKEQKNDIVMEEEKPELSEQEQTSIQIREKSDAKKALGNKHYKAREFADAIKYYDEAWELDSTNLAVLTNKAAVLFEMQDYKQCIEVCEKAIEVGRELRADFKLIGRALGRIGSSYSAMGELDNAVKYFNKSLAESRTPDILTKLRETEALIEKKATEAYINPEIADQEREKGNELFKKSQFPEAVKHYTEAIKRNPSDPKNYSNRAACYAKLMALPEAERDCDKAISLDDGFIKAYIRKAAVQFSKKDYQASIETCNLAMGKDSEGKHSSEIQSQVYLRLILDSKSILCYEHKCSQDRRRATTSNA